MKTLIITGASKGIGLATAKLFVEHDYRVINISRSAPLDKRIENLSIDLAADDAETEIARHLDGLITDGEICLVHNAARLINDSVMGSSTDAFREVMNLNVVAPQILNQAILPRMQAGSAIIYIGSTLSEKAVANSYSYVTSKHAVVGMMRATCQDLNGSGIHTSCICPGFTDTEMLREHVGNDAAVLHAIASGSTMGRLVEPEEIAATILFAAENPVINGAVMHANLGQIES